LKSKGSMELPIDMLIVDEAHNLIGRGKDTIRREFALFLSQISERVVCLTATPIQLELMDFKRILDIVSPGEWTDESFKSAMDVHAGLVGINRLLLDSTKPVDLNIVSEMIAKIERQAMKLGNQKVSNAIKDILIGTDKGEGGLSTNQRLAMQLRIRNSSPLTGEYSRSMRRDVGEYRERIPIKVEIDLDEANQSAYQGGEMVQVSEKGLFEEIDKLLSKSFSNVHRMQLASCIPAMKGLIDSGMEGFSYWTDGTTSISDSDYQSLDERESARMERGSPSLGEGDVEQCKSISKKYRLLSVDTKFQRTLEKLLSLRDSKVEKCRIKKAIIFTQWRPTFAYLKNELSRIEGLKCYSVSGDDYDESRNRILEDFQEHNGFAILLATDIFSEGLDIQSANCVVNYDLPYNPQLIEQRISRVDRIGQDSPTIVIINPIVKGSIDEEIYSKLLSRIRIFETYVSDMMPSLTEISALDLAGDFEKFAHEYERRSVLEELQKNTALRGLDEALDEQAREINSEKRQNFSELRVLLVGEFFRLLFGNERVSIDPVDELVTIKGLNANDIELISNVLPMDIATSISNRMKSLMKSDGHVTFSKKSKTGNWYLPIMHPFVELATNVIMSNRYGQPSALKMPIESITSTKKVPGLIDNDRFIIVTNHEYTSPMISENDWIWWSVDRKTFTPVKVDGFETKTLIGISSALTVRQIEPDEAFRGLNENPLKSIAREHENWSLRIAERSKIFSSSNLDHRMARLLAMRKDVLRMSDRLGNDSGEASRDEVAEIDRMIKETETLRDSYSDTAQIIRDAKIDYRIISVIELEEGIVDG